MTQWHTLSAEVQRINQMQARAHLSLDVTRQAPDAFKVVAQGVVLDTAARPQAKMYIALYENRLASTVTAGK